MSLPGKRFVMLHPDRSYRIQINRRQIRVEYAYYYVVDLHEEFPPKPFRGSGLECYYRAVDYLVEMNYKHDPLFRLARSDLGRTT